jgi:hypothetical protein
MKGNFAIYFVFSGKPVILSERQEGILLSFQGMTF